MLQRRIRKPYIRNTDSDSRERKSYTINHQQFMIASTFSTIHLLLLVFTHTNAIHTGIKILTKKISPRGHITHPRNIGYNSNQLQHLEPKTRYPVSYKQRNLSAQYQSISISYCNRQQLLKKVMPDYLF